MGIEIPDFLMKIEEAEEAQSPRFQLARVEFYIRVETGSAFSLVSLVSCSDEDQTISPRVTVIGQDLHRKMIKIEERVVVVFFETEEYKT